ncbi:MAG: branched-chain amino acid ABC transporter permease [Desulfobacteraceae bacterium]|jgi:branched-chain amino acid transport system permease protein|nr:MAG: branched-chain amino acid ABC transporter permease [Desulfobacteraceae bacterium]
MRKTRERRIISCLGGILSAAILVVLPHFFSSYIVSFMIITLMFIILASSWNLFSGFTGYISLGHGMFFGAGAYSFTLAVVKGGWQYGYAIVLAALVPGIMALLISLVVLTIRMRVAYFAMITLGFNEIFQNICANSDALGASFGFTIPPIRHLTVPYYILLLTAIVLVGGIFFLERSHVGLALKSILQDEEVAETAGVNTTRLKVLFFVLSGIFPGITGAVIGWYWSYIDPYTSFDLVLSFQIAIMAILGGMGTVFGPVIAATFMSVLIEILSTNIPHFYNIIFGILVTVIIIISPKGISELILRVTHRSRS